jgi:hypothetical protein
VFNIVNGTNLHNRERYGFEMGVKVGNTVPLDLSSFADLGHVPTVQEMRRSDPDVNTWQADVYRHALGKGARPGGMIKYEGRCAVCFVGIICCCGTKSYTYHDPETDETYIDRYPCELACCDNHK